jgi:hypothetical protein
MGVVLSVAALRAHLLAAGLAGAVATTREQSLARYRLFAARDPRALIGLAPDCEWDVPKLLALMAERCGVRPGPVPATGREHIDPDLTIAALDAFAERLAAAARHRAPVLLGTAHPHRLQGFYTALASALADAGCPVLTPAQGRPVDIATGYGVVRHHLRYVCGVGSVHQDDLRPGPHTAAATGAPSHGHSHSPLPLRTALAAAVTEHGRLPELVIGDHGWLCAAGQLGIEAIGPADADDPAPFVGQAEGRIAVVVPLNDGASAPHYGPLSRYVLNQARLSQ